MDCIKCGGQRQRGDLLCHTCRAYESNFWHKLERKFNDQIEKARLTTRMNEHVKRGR